jgi:hypothetical protein
MWSEGMLLMFWCRAGGSRFKSRLITLPNGKVLATMAGISSGMESNPIGAETKFATSIKNGWKKACETYLNESDLKEGSEEWKYIMETQRFSQINEVINETWAHYNNPIDHASTPQFVTPSFKTTGYKTIKRKVMKAVGIKESGKIFLQPDSSAPLKTSDVDARIRLEQKLSAKPSEGRKVVDVGLQITDQVQAMGESEKLKTVVGVVLKFSNSLESLVGVSQLVICLLNYMSNDEVGAICFACFGWYSILFQSKFRASSLLIARPPKICGIHMIVSPVYS